MSPLGALDRKELAAALMEVAESDFLTEGKYTRLFEEAVSDWSGMHAVAVNNCGSGLFAILRQLRPCQAVVPTNTFFATGAMTKEAGFPLRLADCSLDHLSMGLDDLQKAETDETGLVVLTHVGGLLAPSYEDIVEHCDKTGRVLVEDAAHALGVKRDGMVAGSLGLAAVFSLYPTKALPAGEGGVVVTRDENLARQLREFRNYGKRIEDGEVKYRGSGFNLRMDEWTAAVAYLQMKRLPQILERREASADVLRKTFIPLPAWRTVSGEACNWYKFPVNPVTPGQWGVTKYAGKIYASSDQLTGSLYGLSPLPKAMMAAERHVCLPVGEGLYEGMKTEQAMSWLREKKS